MAITSPLVGWQVASKTNSITTPSGTDGGGTEKAPMIKSISPSVSRASNRKAVTVNTAGTVKFTEPGTPVGSNRKHDWS